MVPSPHQLTYPSLHHDPSKVRWNRDLHRTVILVSVPSAFLSVPEIQLRSLVINCTAERFTLREYRPVTLAHRVLSVHPSLIPMDPPAVAISPLSTFPVSSEVPPPSPSNQNTIHVPIEIVEEILYYLLSEESTLNNCALVCKYWTPSCRRHIFHQVDFTEPSDFALWCRSIPATPNGPHAYTRKITITNDYFEDGYPQSRNKFALFLRHLTFFSNVQELAIACTPSLRTFDHIFTSSIFSHLSDVVRSLSIRNGYCSPQTLVLLVTSFRCLEHLELTWMRFEPSELLRTLPERPTFKIKGTFYMVDLDSSEQFAILFAEQDLRFREMYVSGEYWLRDRIRGGTSAWLSAPTIWKSLRYVGQKA